MTEGQFPKSNGGIIYSSEINRFSKAGGFLYVGSFAQIGSQTGATVCGRNNVAIAGSFVINSNDVSNPCQIDIKLRGTMTNGYFIGLSGLSTSTYINVGSNTTNGLITYSNILAGSPMNGYIYGRTQNLAFDEYSTVVNGEYISSTSLNNLDVSSPFVLFLGISNATAAANIYVYSIQSFRGVV